MQENALTILLEYHFYRTITTRIIKAKQYGKPKQNIYTRRYRKVCK